MIAIRDKNNTDDVEEILRLATADLRCVYRRSKKADNRAMSGEEVAAKSLVAVEGETVVGCIEYCETEDSLYVRNLAVHPQQRRRGVAKALIREVEVIAAREGKLKVNLSTIKETGNTGLFTRLGYSISNETPALGFEGLDGQPVTKVELYRLLP